MVGKVDLVADPGDGLLGAHVFGGKRRDDVHLVVVRHGDKEIAPVCPGLTQRPLAPSVALEHHGVQHVLGGREYLGVPVDDHYVVSLMYEDPGDVASYLAHSDDDNVHRGCSTPLLSSCPWSPRWYVSTWSSGCA